MADRNIIISILGDDKDFQDAVMRVKSSASSLGSLDGVLAGIGAGFSLDYVITQNEQAEEASAQLAAVVRSTGDAIGLTTEQLEAQAAALAKNTTFSQAQIEAAQAIGLTYTHIGRDVFPQFMQAAADMSTRLGTDLTGSVRLLGKALNDPVVAMNALNREGIQFTATQKEQITYFQNTNQLAQAQGVILDALNQKFGGAAAAQADTLKGVITGIENALSDDVTGGSGVDGLTSSLKDLRVELQDPEIKSGIQNLVSFFTGLIGVMTNTAGVLLNLGKDVGEFVARMLGATGNIDDKIAELDQGITYFQTRLKQDFDSGASNDDPTVKFIEQKIIELQQKKQLLLNAYQLATGIDAAPATPAAGTGAAPSSPVDVASTQTLADATLALARIKAVNDAALASLDEQYKAHNLSIQQYYAQRVADEQSTIDAEIAMRKAELAQAGDDANKKAQIEAQIIGLEAQRQKAAIDAQTAETTANQKYLDGLQKIRDELAKQSGQDVSDAARQAVLLQYQNELNEAKARGDTASISLIDHLGDIAAAKVQLQEIQDQVSTIFATLTQQSQGVQDQVTAGGLTPAQAAQQIFQYTQQAYQAAGALIPQMQQLAAVIGDPKAAAQVAATAAQVEHLKVVTNQFLQQIENAGESSLAQFFDNLFTHTENLRQAFDDMVKSFAQSLAQMESQILAHQLLMSFMNWAFPGSFSVGTAKTAGSSAGATDAPDGFAEGGHVRGPGTETSDSISARLSRGEFVVKARSVRQYGLQMMDSINRGLFPSMSSRFGSRIGGMNFAEGGLVAGAGGFDGGVVINNYTGQQATASTKTTGGGRKQLVIAVGQAIAQDAMAGGAGIQAISQVLGVSRKGAKRSVG